MFVNKSNKMFVNKILLIETKENTAVTKCGSFIFLMPFIKNRIGVMDSNETKYLSCIKPMSEDQH